jgi:hypothetical protein
MLTHPNFMTSLPNSLLAPLANDDGRVWRRELYADEGLNFGEDREGKTMANGFVELATLISFGAAVGWRFSIPLFVWLALLQTGNSPLPSEEWAAFLSTPTTLSFALLLVVIELSLEFAHLHQLLHRGIGILKVLTASLFVSAAVIHWHPFLKLLLGFLVTQFLVVPFHLRRPGFQPIPCASRRVLVALLETAFAYAFCLTGFVVPFTAALVALIIRFVLPLVLRPTHRSPTVVPVHHHEVEERFLWGVTALALIAVAVLSYSPYNPLADRWRLPQDPNRFVPAIVVHHYRWAKRFLLSSPLAILESSLPTIAEETAQAVGAKVRQGR